MRHYETHKSNNINVIWIMLLNYYESFIIHLKKKNNNNNK